MAAKNTIGMVNKCLVLLKKSKIFNPGPNTYAAKPFNGLLKIAYETKSAAQIVCNPRAAPKNVIMRELFLKIMQIAEISRKMLQNHRKSSSKSPYLLA